MNTNPVMTAWLIRCLTCVNSALLAGGLSLGCVADLEFDTEEELGESAERLTGWTYHSKGTTADPTPVDMGSMNDRTCVLSGVAGNLSQGSWDGLGEPARAEIRETNDQHLHLKGHGGAHEGSAGETVWHNNPVLAAATCFFTTLNRWYDILPGTETGILAIGDSNGRRRCFLASLHGIDGAWSHPDDHARVFPSGGNWWFGSEHHTSTPRATFETVCVDFPEGTVFTTGSASALPGQTKTKVITSGTGIKGCGLTHVTGAFNNDSWTDGVIINPPSAINGDWTITVSNGKAAMYTCAK
ncbi:hypothetical protein WME76_23060 [Sorangium sp. So ce119]|uniref:hypothetical protein n=1 Tax=Sorangium sp. So ce119 TaxID=3133279 RepID=UPI003F63BB72